MSAQTISTLPAGSFEELRSGVDVDVVVPVFNEARTLARNVRRLRHYLDRRFPFTAVVTIADNASTDDTWNVATGLAADLRGVRAIRLPRKGRGGALRSAWLASEADVVAYMDVDLATDLDALAPLVAPLLSGHSDLAIGTRLAPGAHVRRGFRRELISRAYNRLVRSSLGTTFSDAQCGFKGVRADAARELVPEIRDDGWFFDTELLVLAQRHGLRIHEVPVDWVDDDDSSVDIVSTAMADIKGLWRLARTRARGDVQRLHRRGRHGQTGVEVARIAGVGLASTLAYLILFLSLRSPLGPYGANALALGCTALGNALAHTRLSADPVKILGERRLGAALLAATGVTLVLSSSSLALASSLGAVSPAAQVLALLVGSACAAPLRLFALYRAAGDRLPATGS